MKFISVSELSANCPILAVREKIVSLSAGDFRLGFFSFLLEGKNDGTAPSTRVSHPTMKKTEICFTLILNLQIHADFLN